MVQERILTRPIVEGQCWLNPVFVKLCQTVSIISKCYRCVLSVRAIGAYYQGVIWLQGPVSIGTAQQCRAETATAEIPVKS